jgi:S-adenosylmethionine/arginine decarboxylase-like enzyme
MEMEMEMRKNKTAKVKKTNYAVTVRRRRNPRGMHGMHGMNPKKWGFHLLLDCSQGAPDRITSRRNISEFVNTLVKKIDMKKYGRLWINKFATHDPSKGGISFMQMIETSNISGHFVDKTGNFYIDVFSCKPYDRKVVVDLVQTFFKPTRIRKRFVYRDAV